MQTTMLPTMLDNSIEKLDVQKYLATLDIEEVSLATAIMRGDSVRKWAFDCRIARRQAYKIYGNIKIKAERYFCEG